MPKFVIERELPGAGKLSQEDLQAIAWKSCHVLEGLGPQIQWVHSYVTDNTMYCVMIAPDEDLIRAHSQRGGLPIDRISPVRSTIDPTTADAVLVTARAEPPSRYPEPAAPLVVKAVG